MYGRKHFSLACIMYTCSFCLAFFPVLYPYLNGFVMTPFSLGMAHTDPLFPCRCHGAGVLLRAVRVPVAWEGFPRLSKFIVSWHEKPRPELHSCTAPAGPTALCLRGSFSRPHLVVKVKISFSRRGIRSLVVQTICNSINSTLGGTPLTHCNRSFFPPMVGDSKKPNIPS